MRKPDARVTVMLNAGCGEQIETETRHAVAAGVDAVVAGGGDGTVSVVAAVLSGMARPFGVLPMGTLNHFAQGESAAHLSDRSVSFDTPPAARQERFMPLPEKRRISNCDRKYRTMSNLTVWLIAGALLGSAVGLSLIADGQRRVMRNIVVATAGSAIGGLFVCPWVGIPMASSAAFDSRGLVVSLISTLIFLAITNLTRDRSA